MKVVPWYCHGLLHLPWTTHPPWTGLKSESKLPPPVNLQLHVHFTRKQWNNRRCSRSVSASWRKWSKVLGKIGETDSTPLWSGIQRKRRPVLSSFTFVRSCIVPFVSWLGWWVIGTSPLHKVVNDPAWACLNHSGVVCLPSLVEFLQLMNVERWCLLQQIKSDNRWQFWWWCIPRVSFNLLPLVKIRGNDSPSMLPSTN